jgi:hypothetical protein
MAQKFLTEITLQALNNATTDTDQFLVSDSGTIKFRTGSQMLSDIVGYTPANDANVVHKTGNESIAGIKTFTQGNTTFSNATGSTLAFTTGATTTAEITINTTFTQFTTFGSFGYLFNGYSGGGISNLLTLDQSGNGIFSANVRATSFTDKDNTAYYLNPAAFSNLYDITANTFVKSGGTSAQYLMADGSVSTGPSLTGYVPTSRTLTINGVTYDLSANRSWTVSVTETDTLQTVTSRGASTNIMSTFNGGITVDALSYVTSNGYFRSGTNGFRWNDSSGNYNNVIMRDNGTTWFRNYVETPDSMRAPIYYDYNDTNFYVDPASSSSLKAIYLTGGYTQYATTVGSPAANFGNGRVYLNVWPTASGSSIMSFKIMISTTWNWAPGFGYITADVSFYFDGTNLNSATTTITSATGQARNNLGIGNPVIDGGNICIPIYSSNSNAVVAKLEGSPSFGWSSVTWGSWQSVAFPGSAIVSIPGDATVEGILQSNSSVRGPIFYDTNNTGYYLDPASTSNIVGLTVANTITGNISGTAGSLLSYQSNWASTPTPDNVVGLLGWKNYGNGHVIFDASASTTPSGTGCSSTNPTVYWQATFPTLMGWNGTNTYGVRVDSARIADSATSAGSVDFNNLTNKSSGTGTYQTSGDFRAPIFYDSDNTAYYTDPASTSNLASSYIAGHYYGSSNSSNILIRTAANSAEMGIVGKSSSGAFRFQLYGYNGTEYGFLSAEWSSWDVRKVTGGNMYLNNQGSYYYGTDTAYLLRVYGTTDMRSPIYYDLDNTAYYVNPNGTSSLSLIIADNTIKSRKAQTNNDYTTAAIWTESYSTTTTGIAFHISGLVGKFLEMRTDGILYWANAPVVTTSNISVTFDSLISKTGGTGTYQTSGDFRAPIFYDSNDTTYYLDPNNTTKSLNVAGKLTVNVGSSSGTPVFEATGTYGTMSINTYYGVLHTSGDFYIGNPASTGNNLSGNYAYFSIFYDRNNSAYYLDPASGSNLNTGNLAGRWKYSNYLVSNNSGGLMGDYNISGTAAKCIWTIGESWPLGNMYGLAYEYDGTYAHSLSLKANGTTYARLAFGGEGAYFTGGVTSGTAMSSPVYYDSANSAYYFDGSDTGDSIRVAGDIVAYYSDERLKDRKGNIENALDKVLSLNGFYYEPNETAQALGYKKKLEVGVSAQEVQAILPEIIKDAPIGGDYKTLDYGRLTPLLIEAIKEQQTQIDELKELVNKLINK